MGKLVALALSMLIGLSVFSTPVLANPSSKADEEELCAYIQKTAGMFMEARYANVPLHELRAVVDKIEDAQQKRIFLTILLDAYSQPQRSSDTSVQQVTNEFSKKYYRLCKQAHQES